MFENGQVRPASPMTRISMFQATIEFLAQSACSLHVALHVCAARPGLSHKSKIKHSRHFQRLFGVDPIFAVFAGNNRIYTRLLAFVLPPCFTATRCRLHWRLVLAPCPSCLPHTLRTPPASASASYGAQMHVMGKCTRKGSRLRRCRMLSLVSTLRLSRLNNFGHGASIWPLQQARRHGTFRVAKTPRARFAV